MLKFFRNIIENIPVIIKLGGPQPRSQGFFFVR